MISRMTKGRKRKVSMTVAQGLGAGGTAVLVGEKRKHKSKAARALQQEKRDLQQT